MKVDNVKNSKVISLSEVRKKKKEKERAEKWQNESPDLKGIQERITNLESELHFRTVKLCEEMDYLEEKLENMNLLNKTLILIIKHNGLKIPEQLNSRHFFRRFFSTDQSD